MNLERGSILFNWTIAQCRIVGARGGRAIPISFLVRRRTTFPVAP